MALSAGSTQTATPQTSLPVIRTVEEKGDLVRFDLDFGAYEIRQVQAYLNDRFPSIRLPVSISKSDMTYEEIDFVDPNIKPAILGLLKKNKDNGKRGGLDSRFRGNDKRRNFEKSSVRLAWLEKMNSSRGSRLAKGELWLDEQVAIRFSLMKSKWSQSPRSWWVALPSRWRQDNESWENLFVIKDKTLKKEITALVREAYLERYYEDD